MQLCRWDLGGGGGGNKKYNLQATPEILKASEGLVMIRTRRHFLANRSLVRVTPIGAVSMQNYKTAIKILSSKG